MRYPSGPHLTGSWGNAGWVLSTLPLGIIHKIESFKIKLLSNKRKSIQLYKTKLTMSKKLANITIKPINKPTYLKTLITKVNIKK